MSEEDEGACQISREVGNGAPAGGIYTSWFPNKLAHGVTLNLENRVRFSSLSNKTMDTGKLYSGPDECLYLHALERVLGRFDSVT